MAQTNGFTGISAASPTFFRNSISPLSNQTTDPNFRGHSSSAQPWGKCAFPTQEIIFEDIGYPASGIGNIVDATLVSGPNFDDSGASNSQPFGTNVSFNRNVVATGGGCNTNPGKLSVKYKFGTTFEVLMDNFVNTTFAVSYQSQGRQRLNIRLFLD